MGYISNDEERLSTDAVEETLPLYEESQRTGELTPPDKSATPDEVREFLVHLMQVRGSLGLDHARRIAARWTVGTGQELRSYPVAMYRDLFGAEDGWAVFKQVRTLCYTREHDDQIKKRWIVGKYCAALEIDLEGICIDQLAVACFIGAMSLMICCMTAFVVVMQSDDPPASILAAIPVALVLGFASVLLGLHASNMAEKPEKRVENELKWGWNKQPSNIQ